jgi:imidazolonepropionase-like amidohydrolase
MSKAPYVLRAKRLFDGTRFIEDPAVLIEGGTIIAVGPEMPGNVATHDLGTATILPGLVDCHQHLVFDGNGTLEEQVSGRTDDELRSRARTAARTALLGGVTTLRDLGDRGFVTLGLRDDPELPTILCSGPPITLVKGHCWYLGGECSSRDDLVAAVRERIARECDVIKIMVTGGLLTPATPMWQSQFGTDELRLVVGEAHAAGLAVAAHCHGLAGIGDAIDAGVDTIEHCTFLNESMQAAPEEALLDRLAQATTAISATMGNAPGAELPPAVASILPDVTRALAGVHARGGRIVVGSDAGITPYKPHDVAHHALRDLLSIGMDSIEALRALTINGAETLELPTKGRIAAGADADLVAVAGDPEDDPEALSRIVQVWKAGNPMHDRTGKSFPGAAETNRDTRR